MRRGGPAPKRDSVRVIGMIVVPVPVGEKNAEDHACGNREIPLDGRVARNQCILNPDHNTGGKDAQQRILNHVNNVKL